jgi:hypothetical protein
MDKEISVEVVATKILQIRGRKVMLDRDLAEIYGVETKQLTRQVRRNIRRFPEDFMFQLTLSEYRELLRCHFGTLEKGKYPKYLPLVFTQDGVAMLSSVLNSESAIQANIHIIRAFNILRRMLLTNNDLRRKVNEMEKKYDRRFISEKGTGPLNWARREKWAEVSPWGGKWRRRESAPFLFWELVANCDQMPQK